MTSNLLMEVPL